MATLYEIDNALLECFDEETGEIFDIDKYESLQMERKTKIENVGLFIKNMESDIECYTKEKKCFEEKIAKAKKRKESALNWLTYALQGEKFKGEKVDVNFRKTLKVCVENGAEEYLPKEYVRVETTIAPNKKLLKSALQNGEIIDGVSLEENLSCSVK